MPFASSIAQPPLLINYQGRLVDGTNLVSGVVNMRFRLHDDPAGGSLLFESTNPVTVVDGLYSTIIGENTVSGKLTDALAKPAVWLELEVDGTILSPRERILSVGYALMADGVKPEGVTEAMLAAESVSASRIASGAVGSAQLATDAVTAGKVDAATFNQTFWRAGGNAGTTGTHYLGTSDNQPLQLHVNGVRVLRLEPEASSPRIIGGHPENSAAGAGSIVGGGGNSTDPNSASADYATVGGGIGNTAGNWATTVSGGQVNTAGGGYATVGGGRNNVADGWYSSVFGGYNNTAIDISSTVGGGYRNSASGDYATVGGGADNTAGGTAATVSGGADNTAGGFLATVVGGRFNAANGDYSFAAGRYAKAVNRGAFVWGDSSNSDVASDANNQVTFRASGGYRLYSNSGLTAGATMGAGLSSWSTLSDRDAKENFEAIDAAAILQRLADLPLTSWNYKADPERRRFIGPMAQDFHAAFDLGDLTTINTLDADGVLFAAVQGLYHQNQELKKENETLHAELELIKSHLGL